MKEFTFTHYLILVTFCLIMAVSGLYLLAHFRSLFRGIIRPEWLRKNIVAWLIIYCFIMATAPMNSYFFKTLGEKGVLLTVLGEMLATTVNTIFVFNTVRLVMDSRKVRQLPLIRQQAIILFTLVLSCVIVNVPLNYIGNNYKTETVKYSVLTSIYMAGITGMVCILMNTIEAERGRKLREKELELSRLNELRIKAELDALHAKVNPHFLYNALNSIADLSVTDGKKARQMTIALADLFRYSINYSHENFSTIRDEVAMTEVYLQIEKIRFEDQLNYSVHVDDECRHYLVPRFILQSIAENAVKHGLKATGKLTEIRLDVSKKDSMLEISISDNGPAFPEELIPGYGVKSVFDKLDLLFPGNFEIFFHNDPRKEVTIRLYKLMKDEAAV